MTVAVVLVAAAVVGLAVMSLGGNKTTGSTSTSAGQALSASTTSTRTSSPASTTTSTAAAPANGPAVYSAPLSGKNEIPPVSTSASGTLELTVAANGASVKYLLTVSKITDLTVARLHEGKAGASGPTIFTIYGGPGKSGVYSGIIAQGTFTAADLQGPLQGKRVTDFVALIKSGQVYLNVGSSAHVQGEIRGQVK
jgi:hypothetical protein